MVNTAFNHSPTITVPGSSTNTAEVIAAFNAARE